MTTGRSVERPDLAARLDRWVDRGLITSDQAERIREDERTTGAAKPQGPSLVAEALGYVGGVLVLVAAATITGRFWSDLGTGGRLAVALVAAGVLLAAGTAAPERLGAASGRLRSVTWLLSAAALGGALALAGDDMLDAPGDVVVFGSAGLTAVYAGALWYVHRWPLQQVALVAALAMAAGGAAALLPRDREDVVGLAVWGVGAAWTVLGWGRVVAARAVAYVCGGVAVIAGSMFTVQNDWGCALAIASAVVLVAVGVLQRDLVLLGVGAVATLFAVPVAMSRYFPDTLVAPFALLAAGALLVVGALYTARRRSEAPQRAAREDTGTPRTATIIAVVVAAAAAAAVLVLGAS